MRTLGVDLASDPKRTGVCVMEWGCSKAEVVELRVGADDEQLLEMHGPAQVTGIDAPFGWPVAFEEAIRDQGSWGDAAWTRARRDELRFRVTDFRVRELVGWWPLSVSSDLIAVPSFRCAGLLERMGVRDRSGDGRVYETYPAASLKAWGLPARGYKGIKGRGKRHELCRKLEKKMTWLSVDVDHHRLLLESDDALDALVAALTARAATLGLTITPIASEAEPARTEGWIHVPMKGSLERLVDR